VKFAVPAAVLSVALVGVVGCSNKTNKAAAEPTPAVTDLTPAPAPAPQPVVVTPAPVAPVTEAPVKEAPAAPAAKGSISGHKYTVKSGDTLYNIAVRKYGKGTAANIAKIEKANPAIKGSVLKVGQTLTLP
jgi:nucleoid-associated protein YgaU